MTSLPNSVSRKVWHATSMAPIRFCAACIDAMRLCTASLASCAGVGTTPVDLPIGRSAAVAAVAAAAAAEAGAVAVAAVEAAAFSCCFFSFLPSFFNQFFRLRFDCCTGATRDIGGRESATSSRICSVCGTSAEAAPAQQHQQQQGAVTAVPPHIRHGTPLHIPCLRMLLSCGRMNTFSHIYI